MNNLKMIRRDNEKRICRTETERERETKVDIGKTLSTTSMKTTAL